MSAPDWQSIAPTLERAHGSYRDLEALGLAHERDQLAAAWRDALDALGVNALDDERDLFLVAGGIHLVTRLLDEARALTGLVNVDELLTITLAGLAHHLPETTR